MGRALRTKVGFKEGRTFFSPKSFLAWMGEEKQRNRRKNATSNLAMKER